MSDTPKPKKYKIIVMVPGGDGDREHTATGDSIVCDGETNIVMLDDEIQVVVPSRYSIIQLIKTKSS